MMPVQSGKKVALAKKGLTVKRLESLEPAPAGKRTVIWDDIVPSFGIRVTDKGKASFFVMRRVDRKLVRHTLDGLKFEIGFYPKPPEGEVEKNSGMLARARQTARDSLSHFTNGISPVRTSEAKRADQEATRLAEQKSADNTFGSVAEAFLAGHVSRLRSRTMVAGIVRRELVGRWKDRPITSITKSDVRTVVDKIAKGDAKAPPRPAAAHQAFAHARSLFRWAVESDYLAASPCDKLSSVRIAGVKPRRDRVLSDREIRRLWEAAELEGYAIGDLTRFLLLTGQRLRECAKATWSEFDLNAGIWVIPASRMKGGQAHEIPLAPMAVELLRGLPRWNGGDYLFTTTDGRKPVAGFENPRKRLDRRIAAQQDDGEALGPIPAWSYHDLRRTLRTNLGGLPVPDTVAELCIAHRQDGLRRTYDLHGYRAEKRRAFELWEARLRSIVEPPPPNVVAFRGTAQ